MYFRLVQSTDVKQIKDQVGEGGERKPQFRKYVAKLD
jgi:hypothetical protein